MNSGCTTTVPVFVRAVPECIIYIVSVQNSDD